VQISMDFVRLGHRSVMKFLTKEGNGPKVNRERMLAEYGDASEHQLEY
jgi:hypothetical protein